MLKEHEEYGKNSAKWAGSRKSMARLVIKEQDEHGKNSAKGTEGVSQNILKEQEEYGKNSPKEAG